MSRKCLYCYNELGAAIQGDFHGQCSLEIFGTREQPEFSYSLEQMDELAKNVIERSVAVPGVQPKLSLTMVNATMGGDKAGRLTVVGALGGNYIFKPPSAIYQEMPANEHLTMRMAESFGMKTAKSSLIRLKSGELSYITKRFDRTDEGKKIHMIDMFQILEAFDKYKSSMEKVGSAVGQYSSRAIFDKLYFLELTIFSFLTGNSDMHLKNFSMILNGEKWIFSPAYDLLNVAIVNPADKEELALTLEGKKRKLSAEHFDRLGKNLGLNGKQIGKVFERFNGFRDVAEGWVDRSFLSDEFKEKYIGLMDQRYKILFK
ncbi:HipA domain-containing protein [Pedobacter sp. PLR]|uniref:HipA domain-containing protein n=1 Tax=Pedobacter sp. PLR TaxID=2994465 RepID=UPI0022472123|nr:HipA domain-containing protein [Pedobacter sp. PLR]MCX2453837.1 HipA domain-containing protein [Pedobacter sp. PLR]